MPVRLTIFSILLLVKSILNAQQITTDIVVISPTGKKITLYVNDNKVNNEPQAIVKVFDISEGWCKLKAEFSDENCAVIDSIRIKPIEKYNGKEITLSISESFVCGKKAGKFEFISIGEKSGPKQPIVPELPVYLSAITENAVFGNIFQIKNNQPDYFKNFDSIAGKCGTSLNEKDIEYHVNLLLKTNDFSNRYKYTEKAVLYNCYSVTILTKLLNTLEIEMDKLKLAKRAYNHLTDKENSKLLGSAFKFKSMAEDYSDFLKGLAATEFQKNLVCDKAINDAEFITLYQSIVQVKYEYDKIVVAQKAVQKKCLSSAQAKKLVDIFSHDREKLELAKSAYISITDKENYKLLADCFLFSENRKDFLNYISK